jgi:hypothetical protein
MSKDQSWSRIGKGVVSQVIGKLLNESTHRQKPEDTRDPLIFNRDANVFDNTQSHNRFNLASALFELRETGNTVVTKSDLVIQLIKRDKTGQFDKEYRSYLIDQNSELIGDVSLNVGGLEWQPAAESIGMLHPSLKAAASCQMNFSAIFTRTGLKDRRVSWLLDIYRSQFHNGMLAMHRPHWDMFFYSSGTLWTDDQQTLRDGVRGQTPFFKMYDLRTTLNDGFSFSFTSDALQTHGAMFYSEDSVLDLSQFY